MDRVTRQTLRKMLRSRLRGLDFKQPQTTPYRVPIPYEDLQRLILGLCVRDMDHKWIFVTDGPDPQGLYVVNMVRSWTGILMIKLRIRAELDEEGRPRDGLEAKMEEIEWERDESLWPLDDFLPSAARTKEFVRELCEWLLEIKLPSDDEEAVVNE